MITNMNNNFNASLASEYFPKKKFKQAIIKFIPKPDKDQYPSYKLSTNFTAGKRSQSLSEDIEQTPLPLFRSQQFVQPIAALRTTTAWH